MTSRNQTNDGSTGRHAPRAEVDPAGGDFQLEAHLGRILRLGVRLSTACLAVGLLLTLASTLTSVGSGLMIAGLLALIATPIARVAASVADYRRRHDWKFFALTLIVLAELCAGIIAALVFHTRL